MTGNQQTAIILTFWLLPGRKLAAEGKTTRVTVHFTAAGGILFCRTELDNAPGSGSAANLASSLKTALSAAFVT